jgi:hypothetical protein
MTDKMKKLERDRIRLRKTQQSQVVDERRAKKLTKTRTQYWKLKQKSGVIAESISEVEEKKPEKEKKKKTKERKKKEKEPELEVVDEEPETTEDEFDDLYTYDEEIEDEEEE